MTTTSLLKLVAVVSCCCVQSIAAQLAVSDGKLSVVSSSDGMTSVSSQFMSDAPSPVASTHLSAGDVFKLSFSVSSAGEGMQPHQAMIQWLPVNKTERTRGRDYLAVVKVRKGGNGKWDSELSRMSPSLLSLASNGEVEATLLIGHFKEAPLSIPLGTFTIAAPLVLPFPFPADETMPKSWEMERFKQMPEMAWTFKAAEKKVNSIISTAGSLVVLAPWVVLVGLAGHINPSLASPTLNILSFLLCLFSFEALIVAYWTSLRLLTTLPYFGILFALTAFTGKKALGDMRKRRLLREATEAGKKSQ